MTTRKPAKLSAFLWHRRIGLIAIILVVILAITGILLNHTDALDLDESYVESGIILDWYGLNPRGEAISYNVNQHRVTQWQDTVFFDERVIVHTTQTLRGAITAQAVIVVEFDAEVVLLSDAGELIDRFPTGIRATQRLGMKAQRPVIETIETQYYMADANIIDWSVIGSADIVWSEPASLDAAQRHALLQAFRGKGLTMERVILDLHSGRIFGSFGVYIMDAAAIALLWLAFSGLWIWWSRRQKIKTKRHYQKHHRN